MKRLFSRRKVFYSIRGKKSGLALTTESLRSMLMRQTAAEDRLEIFGQVEQQQTEEALIRLDRFFVERRIQRKTELPINHPDNLDIAVENGYRNFYRKAGMTDKDCVVHLAFALSVYLKEFENMETFRDVKPDVPTGEYLLQKLCSGNKILTIFPLEYSREILSRNTTFQYSLRQIKALTDRKV